MKEIGDRFRKSQVRAVANLKYMKCFYELYPNRPQDGDDLDTINNLPQLGVDSMELIFRIPWGQNKLIIDKCKNNQEKGDGATVGLLICKTKDNVLAKYAVNAMNVPIGISEYELNRLIPEQLKGTMPTIEEIESELQ